MRKIAYLIAPLICFLCNLSIDAFAQDKYYLTVRVNADSIKPIQSTTSEHFTNDKQVDSIFHHFRVFVYKQSYPDFNSTELRNLFYIYANGDIDSLKTEIESIGKFDEIKKEILPKPSCQNSFSFNDTVAINSAWGNWGFDLIESQCAWTITKGDSNIFVGVVDTEFDTTHEDLHKKIAYVSDFYPNEPIFEIHGTKVSGIVTARTNNLVGIASLGYYTKVGGYRVSSSDFVPEKIKHAYHDGIRIINVSWSGTGLNYPYISNMTDSGVVLILAAGNHSSDSDHYNIANIPGVILVSGVDFGNRHDSSHTAHHDRVDLCAPAHAILTTVPGGYMQTSGGTSISAPFVSATAALILSLNSCLTPAEVEYIIKATTDTIADGASYPGLLGTGRLNAYKAVLLAKDFKHEITTNTTWTGKNKYGADISIDSGAVLTIHDTLLMGCNNHLIVKPGGKLVLDNAYLSTLRYVSGFWPGIVVEGRTNQPQIASKQGTLVMINSIIENAQIAICNYKDNTYLTSGGIIQASQSTFRNNAKALDLKWYASISGVADKCYFDRCTFTVNDNFKGGDFGEHVYLEWEAGIRFKGCNFYNERTGINHGKGIGIHTFDAGFYMSHGCTENTDPCNATTINNKMEGFNIGILNDGDNGFSYAATTVDETAFDKNSIGIHNTTADHISVFHSSFKVGHGAPIDGSGCGQNIGIHTENTHNFRIEENNFTGYPNTSVNDWHNYGIITENSGNNNNEIYKNSFATLNRACVSKGCERGGQTGLRYICNNFTNNQADMVIEGAIVQNGLFHRGINELQGYEIVNNTNAYITSSGNYFVGNDTNIINNGELIFYLHNNANGYIPTHYTPLNNITLAVATNSNTCMSKLNGGVVLSAQDQADLIGNISSVSDNLSNAIATLNDAMDGGQVENITNFINEPNAQETYNLLLQVAPYVSKETMSLVARSELLSQSAMMDVLIENPDLLRDGSLMRYLCDTLDLSDIRDASEYLIDNYGRTITLRTEQENQINNLIHLINNGYNLLVTSAKNDTDFTYYSYIPQWLDSMKTFTAMLDKANFYFGNKQTDSALATLASIPERLREQDVDSAEIANYRTIYSLLQANRNDTTHKYHFSTTDVSRLQSIADANLDASSSYFAKSVLTQIDAYHPIYCVTMPPLAASRQVISFGKTYQKSTTLFKAYPNPTKEVVYFNFEVPDAVNNLRIDITNLMGEHVQTIETSYKKGKLHWDTNNVPNGYYFYQLHDGNKLLSVGKIAVQH